VKEAVDIPQSPENICSADGSTHTESNKLYRKIKHRSPPKSFLTPTAKARPARRRSRRLQGRRAPHTEHGLGVLLATQFLCVRVFVNCIHTYFIYFSCSTISFCPSTTTTVCSLRMMTPPLTLTTAMQIAAAYGGDEL